MAPKYNRDTVFNAGEGAGKSGSFFFFSYDNKFIIKTISESEMNTYLKRVEQFSGHFKKNPSSLLARIFGIFTITTQLINNVHVMLMENAMDLEDPGQLRYVFDLKGS